MKIDTVLLFMTIPLFLILIVCYNCITSYAQWMLPSIPSPYLKESRCCNYELNKSDTFPPKISVVTDKLHEGNNILFMKIVDESPLMHQELKYSIGNESKSTYLAKASDNNYRALVKVVPPVSQVEIEAIDVNGNQAQLQRDIKVEEENNYTFFSDILNSTFWKDKIFGDRIS